MTQEQLKIELSVFTGTENYYKHPLGILFTDGVKYLCTKFECFWLLDTVAAYQHDQIISALEFQVFKLDVNLESQSAMLKIEDGNNHVIKSQIIGFTDIILKSVVLWCQNKTCYLPSEH